MSISEDAYVAQMQALLPPGKAWSRRSDSDITKVLEGLAPELARIEARGDDLLLEMNPGTATELLPEHENTLGLTPASGATVDQRRAALLAKIQETSGHNPADYSAFASAYGYPGAVFTRQPLRPYRMRSRMSDRLRGESWAHAYFAEYMPHLLAYAPNDINGWSGVAGTANVAFAPDGTQTADRVTFLSSGAFGKTTGLDPTNRPQFSVWLRTPTGVGARAVDLITFRDTPPNNAEIFSFSVTERWQRFQIRSALGLVNTVGFARNSSSGGAFDVYAWGAYAGAVDTGFEAAFMNRQQAHSVPLFRVIGDRLAKD